MSSDDPRSADGAAPAGESTAPSAEEWLIAYATELGVPAPSAEEIETLLSLAGVAAHASARQAAPITTWLAARAGLDPEQALAVARRLAEQLGAGAD